MVDDHDIREVADALSEMDREFDADHVASILYDLLAGVSAEDILEDLQVEDDE